MNLRSPFAARSRPGRCAGLMAMALWAVAGASAKDAFVVLSGGGTPLSNNYSQYLQAKAMSADLQRNRPADAVWIFFGAGNRPGEPVALADVHRQVKDGGVLRDTWLPGALPHNRRASKEEFLRALREEILPRVHDGGTLYLFVGDHGERAKAEPRESVITMWRMVNRDGTKLGWNTDPAEELRVSELRAALAAGLGQGRVVFCMTQCYSGDFHFLGAPKVIAPNPGWFRVVPSWAVARDTPALPAVAGFTSVDENSIAAGCDPDPDPDQWAGYERFLPEALLGTDLFDGRKTGAAQPSYAAAHEAAVLADQTIDRPRSTSEQYLERWARLIEKLAAEPGLTPAAKTQVELYQQGVTGGLAEAKDPEFVAERARISRFLAAMDEQNPAMADILQSGSTIELERAVLAEVHAPHRTSGDGHRLWKEVLRPAWKRAVEAGRVKEPAGAALAFERYLLAQEDKGREMIFKDGWRDPILNDLYWRSGYAFPSELDATKAEAITRWGAERRGKIVAWARTSPDRSVQAAAAKLAVEWLDQNAVPPDRTLSRRTAAERTLFYRRVLAAWAFLINLKEATALAQLHRYIELERTPLPAARE